MPASRLSTYIVCSSGWSNPVWNLSAAISTREHGSSVPADASGIFFPSIPLFMLASVYDLPGTFRASEEKPVRAKTCDEERCKSMDSVVPECRVRVLDFGR